MTIEKETMYFENTLYTHIELKDKELNDQTCGTLHYMPPEAFASTQRDGKTFKAGDMWSIGVVCYILVCGKRPFYGRTRNMIMTSILKNNVVWPNDISLTNKCKNFISKLLDKNPKTRLTVKQALNDPWLKNQSSKALGAQFHRNMLTLDLGGMFHAHFIA